MRITILASSLLAASTSGLIAATSVLPGDEGNIPGVNTFEYDTYFVLGSDHSAAWTDDTDAYSWDHPMLASDDPTLGNQTGWTHLTRWVAFSLVEASTVDITIGQVGGVLIPDQNNPGETLEAGADLVPGFTLWAGFEADGEDRSLGFANPQGGHRWDNDGNETAWADVLDYRLHDGNDAGAAVIEASIFLPAGDYTLNIAGAKPGAFDPSGGLRQGFAASLVTSVPEPSSALLLPLGLVAFLTRRTRG